MKALSLSGSNFRWAKFKTENLSNHLERNIIKSGLIPEKNYDFFNSKHFHRLVKNEQEIWSHTLLYKKIKETKETVTLKIVNLTHSNKVIKINNEIVNKIKVGTYWQDGKEKIQYVPAASWELEITKDEYNEMVQDVTNDL